MIMHTLYILYAINETIPIPIPACAFMTNPLLETYESVVKSAVTKLELDINCEYSAPCVHNSCTNPAYWPLPTTFRGTYQSFFLK